MHIHNTKAYPLISVIVPVYKVEPYLRRCVESILAQTYTNLEIILVDDGSPDSCPAICDEYAECDNRVRVVHKPNEGLSVARNTGVAIATGELIGFVDSDDFIAPEMYEKLYAAMEKQDADMTICNHAITDDKGNVKIRSAYGWKYEVYSLEDVSPPLAIMNRPMGSWVAAWDKLYKRDVVAPFPAGKQGEDIHAAYHAIAKCSRIVTIHDSLYFYVQRTGSTVHSHNVGRLDACGINQDLFEFCKMHKLKQAAGRAITTSVAVCIPLLKHLHGKEDRKLVRMYLRWVLIQTLLHPIWVMLVLWKGILRYKSIKRMNDISRSCIQQSKR